MAKIIIARHGQTAWNVDEVFRGRIDVELNETGIKQAELLGRYLSRFKIDAVYSSPLARARKTAEMIAVHQRLKVEIAPGLIDLDFGAWQGLTVQEVKNRYRELYEKWANSPETVIFPSGESLLDVRKRAISVVGDVLAKYQGMVVLVSHRVVNKVLVCALLGLDSSHFWNIRQDTCGITTFSYENGRFILDEHSNTSYLQPLSKPASDF